MRSAHRRSSFLILILLQALSACSRSNSSNNSELTHPFPGNGEVSTTSTTSVTPGNDPDGLTPPDEFALLRNAVSEQVEDQKNRVYQSGLAPEGIRNGNESVLLLGSTQRAALVVHGFLGSPHEVLSVAERLHQDGLTVFAPLIEGFGTSGEFANATPSSEWKNTFWKSLAALGTQFNEVDVVGFSLGGALAVDYLIHEPEIRKNHPEHRFPKIRSLTLLSPYFDDSLIASLTLTSIFKALSSSDLIRLSHFRLLLNDLRPMIHADHASFYNQELPLRAVTELLEFGAKLREVDPRFKSPVPTFLAYSEFDGVTKWKTSKKWVTQHFLHSKIFAISASKKVPHQITLPDFNRAHFALLEQISTFRLRLLD